MWYLDKELKYILIMAAVYIGVSFVSQKGGDFFKKYPFPLIFTAFLFYYNLYTGIFYFIFIGINFMLAQWILKTEKYKKQVFVCSVALNIIAFLSISIYPYLPSNSLDFISFIGFSYAFLKLVDLIYYAYFFAEEICAWDALSYLLFTPVFTSGPIMAFNDFKNQLHTKQEAIINLENPIQRIMIGFAKKIILISLLYQLHDHLLEGELNFFLSFFVLFLFYIIGYLDFSGYSDIAIGFGALMGITVPENFKMPFLSPSLTVFWKNWHITLGTWIKGHISVFIKPKNRFLGGLSSFLIMIFVGIWHKFSFMFFLWGMWHGIFLFIEGCFNLGIVNKKKTPPLIYYGRCLITNIIVTLGCLFFYTDMAVVFKILKGFLRF